MKRKSIFHSVSIRRNKIDSPLQKGLAYTPAQMYEMTQRGIPVSSDNAASGQFYDGEVNIQFEPTFDRRRGVDPASLWNVEQDIKKKAKKAQKTAFDAYQLTLKQKE